MGTISRRIATVVLAGLGLVVVPSGVTTPADAATTPGRNGWIVYGVGGFGEGDLVRTNAAGNATEILAGGTDHDGQPAVSPDGTRIAFASQRGDNVDIWVMDADGGEQTRLTTHPAIETSPAWSADGRRIFFVSDREARMSNVYVMNADGTGVRRLTDAAAGLPGSSPAPSPDGRRVAFVSAANGPDVWVMDVDGGDPRRLTHHDGATDTDPAWSPDGRTIAFSSDRDGARRIHLMDPDGTDVRPLTTGGNDSAPDFSPDGTALVFTRYATGSPGIWTIDSDGGEPVRLADSSTGGHASWGASPVVCQGTSATITGTAGSDVLRGTPGPDVIAGLGGNDTLVGFDGADIFCGGAGVDTVSYSGHEGRVTADLTGGVGDDGSPEDGPTGSRDTIGKDVESLAGGWGDDTLTGSSGANRLDGGVGDDVLRGGHGRDALYGGAGRDSLLAVDDLRDTRVDCGAGTDAAARRDRVDPRAVSCP